MGSNNLEENILSETLSMFRNTDPDNSYVISPDEGIRLINGWLQALQGDPNLDQLTGQLGELRTALQATEPDGSYIRELMTSLADKTAEVAEGANSEGTWTGGLESLSKILRTVGSQS